MNSENLGAWCGPQRVGSLSRRNDGAWRFVYDVSWIDAPGSYDLSPMLPRDALVLDDAYTELAVRHFFENLLPDGQRRLAAARECRTAPDDAFALLRHLGQEPAGGVSLRPDDAPLEAAGVRMLAPSDLAARIRAFPQSTLMNASPKRVLLAGERPKLGVLVDHARVLEPVGSQLSTHVLKPDWGDERRIALATNEMLVMRMAARAGVPTAPVDRVYLPQPALVVTRFDRVLRPPVRGTHVVDGCQMLNEDVGSHRSETTLDALREAAELCRDREVTTALLFRWIVFNIATGNQGSHLKNLSFRVGDEAPQASLAPFYDLVSTVVYALRDAGNDLTRMRLGVELPGAATFGEVTREILLHAGVELGLTRRIAERELNRLSIQLPAACSRQMDALREEHASTPSHDVARLAGEQWLAHMLEHEVIGPMLQRIGKPQARAG